MPETTMKVLLVKHTPDPETIVAMAAKLCYSPSDVQSLQDNVTRQDQRRFVERLVKMGHMSPVEHISFTFAVEGISRACSHQLVRHRLASYSQQSQRYVGETGGFDYVIPPTVKADRNLRKAFVQAMDQAQAAYNDLCRRMQALGMAGEAANQDARFVLPNASETKIIITMNARELLHFFRVRCCRRAQWEIRHLAEQMLALVKQVAPVIFEKAGPGCLYSACPEGEYTCGKIKAVREKYGIKKEDKPKSA